MTEHSVLFSRALKALAFGGLAVIFSLIFLDVAFTNGKFGSDGAIRSTYMVKNAINKANPFLSQEKRMNLTKWIVVTSINPPTEDLKRLASQPGWAVVVVADTKTPRDWNLTGAHFLSVEDQMNMGLALPAQLPFRTYTRKNVGYLFAILNGAEWIYDTDDDNKPYGLGLEQFDYGETVSGLRYQAIRSNSTISERLFNPYSFYGNEGMWPRGFPLEYLNVHTNGDDRYLLCREMRPAAVQQGIVHKDPDVDAIYRLLHADPNSGLNERFNQFAPPILLDHGTYAPWNSQNTLFHKNAFFTMFLPTTVEFRVTDIWRSYFSQKLLHLIGENVAFYPVNAIQIRNAHNYLADFEDENSVYLKSGAIVEFLNEWTCSEDTAALCTLELAKEFSERHFFEEGDVALINTWIRDLEEIGYVFPPLVASRAIYRPLLEEERGGNCRKANLNLKTDLTTNYTEPQYTRAEQKVKDFGELLQWCDDTSNTSLKNTNILTPHMLALKHAKLYPLTDKLNSVLVLTNNYPWTRSIGLLQRLYEPYFGMIIFCGTRNPDRYHYNETVPKMRASFNYVNVTVPEMYKGFFAYYCIAKVQELRLQNVKGYYFVSDDNVFNIWRPNEMDSFSHPIGINRRASVQWWTGSYGKPACKRIIELIETKYAKDERRQKLWREFGERLAANNHKNATQHMLSFNGRSISDFFYIPAYEMDFFGDLAELFAEGKLFLETAVSKMLYAAKKLTTPHPFNYMWGNARGIWHLKYNASYIMNHPIKFSKFEKDNSQSIFCSSVIETFKKELYN